MAVPEVKLQNSTKLQVLADKLAAAKRIVVVTGAGISTNCGIPDFRSKEGLYSMVNKEYNSRLRTRKSSTIGNLSGKDLFDSALWNDELKTSVFYTFIASLRQRVKDVKRPSDAHKFIRTLRDQRKLVRCYTQNVDGLESREKLSLDLSCGKGSRTRFTPKALALPSHPNHLLKDGQLYGGCEVVPLHGDLQYLRCTFCQETFDWEQSGHDRTYLSGFATQCDRCVETDEVRRAGGKRGLKIGTLRPNVVLYGEPHPNEDALSACLENDLSLRPDLLLIMGTSLKVKGIQRVVTEFAKTVHSKNGGTVIFINKTKPADSTWGNLIDYWVNMDCDRYVADLKKRRPDVFTIQASIPFIGVGKSTEKKSSDIKDVQKKPGPNQKNGVEGKENNVPSISGRRLLTPKKPKQSLRDPTSSPLCTKRTPLKTVQLPTPPSSGSNSRKRSLCQERVISTKPDETPSKKRKNFHIWTELSDSTIPISEDIGAGMYSSKSKLANDAEIPDSEDSSSSSLDPSRLENRIQILRDSVLNIRRRGRPKTVTTPEKIRPPSVPKRRLAQR